MFLYGIITIGSIGIHATYIYTALLFLLSAVVYFSIKKLYRWAIQRKMLRLMTYIAGSFFVLGIAILIALIRDGEAWQFLKTAMQSVTLFGICLAIFPLLQQFLLKRK